jgi:hypothetical protein
MLYIGTGFIMKVRSRVDGDNGSSTWSNAISLQNYPSLVVLERKTEELKEEKQK